MKISVVTAVWNRADTIGQAIESVGAQTYGNVEHIIQDGGSTDGTLDVVRSSAPNAALVSEKDAGIYDAINRGIARATGDVIGLMHSDDYFANDTVLADVAAAMGDGVDGVYGDLDYVSAADTSRVIRHWVSGGYEVAKLRQGWMPPHPTLYLRREVFEAHGLYDTSYRISADYEAMLRYLTRGVRLAYLPSVMVKMRVGGESNASIRKILRKSGEDLRAMKLHGIGGVGTLAMKNLSKVRQFVAR